MLVLSRRIGQAIIIGDDIRIIVLRSYPNWVRLGIQAPDDIYIARAELEDMLPDQTVGNI